MAAPEHILPSAPEPTGDPAVRPKILKRPAQFSTPIRTTAVALAPRIAEQPMAAPATPTSKSWQDDGRFAIALLAIVILMNVVVSYWLAHVQRPTAAPTSVALPEAAPVDRSAIITTEAAEAENDGNTAPAIHVLDDTAPAATAE